MFCLPQKEKRPYDVSMSEISHTDRNIVNTILLFTSFLVLP